MSALTHPLIADLTKCTGCKVCEMACSLEKEKVCNPHQSRIRILKQDTLGVFLPVISPDCDLCGGPSEEQKCVKFCSTQAIKFVALGEAALLRKKMGLNQFVCPTIPGRRAMEAIYR
ncbi:MAG: hypothetical protein V1850_05715 [Candidatus Bathyarchaeota archaeon]